MMNKSTADPSGNYADFLASTVESNKDAFTEDELNTLTTDIETIRKIEEQIAEIEKKDTTSESADANDNSGSTSPFQNFSGQDYDGNTVDESLFPEMQSQSSISGLPAVSLVLQSYRSLMN